MKKCPFCAEEIQDEAIKCRFCNSFLSQAPGGGGAAAPTAPEGAGAKAAALQQAAGTGVPPFAEKREAPDPSARKVVYDGSPSWKAYLGYYVIGALVSVLAPVIFNWVGRKVDASTSGRILFVAIPIAAAVIYFFGHL